MAETWYSKFLAQGVGRRRDAQVTKVNKCASCCYVNAGLVNTEKPGDSKEPLSPAFRTA